MLALALLLVVPAFAQKNKLNVSAVGDLNPASVVYLTGVKPAEPMLSWNKSALGGAVEYRRWFKPHVGMGGFMEGNTSDGKLLPADRERERERHREGSGASSLGPLLRG